MIGIIGKKVGMTRIFDERGKAWAVSVVEAGPCHVTQIKTQATDGYAAIQMGFGETRPKLLNKPLQGHLAKSGGKTLRFLKEFRDFEGTEGLKAGELILVDRFAPGDVVSVTGTSKGHGFAGVIKRHHFGGGPVTHGQSDRTRAPGSLGQSSYPSRVYKGMRMAGRMGGSSVTIKNLKILKVDPNNNLIIIKGAIPGAINSVVYIKK